MRYDHFCMLEESEKKFLEHHHGKRIPDDGCICRPHSGLTQNTLLNGREKKKKFNQQSARIPNV